MQRLTDHPSPIGVPARGPREIRALQRSFNRLVTALNDYRERITNMERANIGRYLTHHFRNSLTPLRLGADQLAEEIISNGAYWSEAGGHRRRLLNLLNRDAAVLFVGSSCSRIDSTAPWRSSPCTSLRSSSGSRLSSTTPPMLE